MTKETENGHHFKAMQFKYPNLKGGRALAKVSSQQIIKGSVMRIKQWRGEILHL